MVGTREIFTKELEQVLIDAVRDRQCIWDKSNDKYKNTPAREGAWTEIATLAELTGDLLLKSRNDFNNLLI